MHSNIIKHPLIFAVESSCDETAVALYQGGVLCHKLYSQLGIHREHQGVVPELAARSHLEKLAPLTKLCLAEAGINKKDIEAVAYTKGPGLIPCLMAGASYARSMAYALGVPALGVHHLEGHLLSPLLGADQPSFPYVALLASGGNTQLYLARDYGDYELHGRSVDDAAGEAFDKTAILLGLSYPGGAALEQLAKQGDAKQYPFTMPMAKSGDYNFSFSGLKTQVRYLVQDLWAQTGAAAKASGESESGSAAAPGATASAKSHDKTAVPASADSETGLTDTTRADIAASFQHTIVNGLVTKAAGLAAELGVANLAIVGGVSANSYFRRLTKRQAEAQNLRPYFAPLEYCTDNAVMIALAAEHRLARGEQDSLQIKAAARLPPP